MYPFLKSFSFNSHRISKPIHNYRLTGITTISKKHFSNGDHSCQESNGNLQKFTALSFFKFMNVPEEILDVTVSRYRLEILKALPLELAKGTLIVATEGINGQFCVPSNFLDDFLRSITAITYQTNPKTLKNETNPAIDFNIGETLEYPIPKNNLSRSIKETLSVPEGRPFPFRKLIVRRKKSILTDGGLQGIDWEDAGPEMTPAEWHSSMEAMQQQPKETRPILIDCRNSYESQMGSFAGALPLDTHNFGESWPRLEQLLSEQGAGPQTPIMTFCTGGIRCVKVNAYLRQRLGLQNVSRLQKGIIGYEQWLAEHREDGSLFEGDNFLFDRRRLEEPL
mmetsp:Transcript_6343/g.8876  ORF Transcript_6343/g.8876 Transcript_6343/m.8876 type:complete len:338 (+) Transcript_6343:28-1041(+)